MSQCQKCGGRAQLFLCGTCTRELKDMLYGLAYGQKLPTGQRGAGWIEHLQDKVNGLTREGESERRSTERNGPLMVHLEASRLLDQVHATLVRWVQDICDSWSYPAPRMYPRDFIGPLPEDAVRGHATKATRSAAIWLAHNVSAIACDENAGMCWREIKDAIDAIERMINRPIPPRYCGPCPACNTALKAARDDVEVMCPVCRVTHNVERLEQELWAGVDTWLLTHSEVLMVMAYRGDPVPERTLRHWRATGRLLPRGYRGEKPGYWLADVHELRNNKTEVA